MAKGCSLAVRPSLRLRMICASRFGSSGASGNGSGAVVLLASAVSASPLPASVSLALVDSFARALSASGAGAPVAFRSSFSISRISCSMVRRILYYGAQAKRRAPHLRRLLPPDGQDCHGHSHRPLALRHDERFLPPTGRVVLSDAPGSVAGVAYLRGRPATRRAWRRRGGARPGMREPAVRVVPGRIACASRLHVLRRGQLRRPGVLGR